ncbi:hypothetical protein FHS16_004352 [Paenibacillus endophyticus]|uniref:Uncharacterized protein n=1 Tax=Paenibacillus endophyticus TaxID=1294268 RepID=A0A7W5GBX0_9BACL|nr:hypothetical protein [Paenibacillus endophyticus]MBB3154270.1 hypothetical protein [Paenibacillus endophyticus]
MIVVTLNGCGKSEKIEHIEAFATEMSEQNAEGIFERTGYKKVNAITSVVEGEKYVKSEIKKIEDHYDIDGNFIKSEITLNNSSRSEMFMSNDGDEHVTKLDNPSTILVPELVSEEHHSVELTEEQKTEVKAHVLSFLK